MRTLLLVGAMTMLFTSNRTLPLADSIAAYFVVPFVAAALAPLVLNERLTWAAAMAATLKVALQCGIGCRCLQPISAHPLVRVTVCVRLW